MRPRVVICLPTYNESSNLERMTRALAGALDFRRFHATVLVVDDSSPDGTGELADRLADEVHFLDVLHRPRKEGLGRAYLAAFRRALAKDADLVVSMDCDFSHDPLDISRLLEASTAADVVIGSRYARGGEIRNWGLIRRAVSRSGCLYARAILGVAVRDVTSGFKCYRRKVLEETRLDRVRSEGYAFQIEMVYRAIQNEFRVIEIPITFADREAGVSKMSPMVVLEAAARVPALRLAALSGRL